jgi:hypothetical protein
MSRRRRKSQGTNNPGEGIKQVKAKDKRRGGPFLGPRSPRFAAAVLASAALVLGAPALASASQALTVTKVGNGPGTVTSFPAGISCGATCTASFGEGSTITLAGFPGLHSKAVQWAGCDSVNGESKCEVTMSAAKAVTASFELEPQYAEYTVSVAKTGTGSGTVTGSAGGIDCGAICSGVFPYKTLLTLTATPAEGSVFSHWAGGNCSGSEPCERSINSTRTVHAVFSAVGQRTLSLTMAGAGAGVVKSKKAGIECSTSCSPLIAAGTKLTLTATAAPGSSFAGFSGACSGAKSCKVLMSEAHSVTATFNKAPTPAPGVAIVAAKAKVKGGRAFVRVSCHGPTSCRGPLKLTAKLGGKSTAIGAASFSLAPGSSTTLKVKLSAAAKQALKSAGKLKARVSGAGIAAHAVRLKG